MTTTPELIAACKAVTEKFPYVDHLFISADGRWLFCEDLSPPDFQGMIDTYLLEDMVDSLYSAGIKLPCAFYIPEVLA